LPGVHPDLLKAQYYQESRLMIDAQSPKGAAGIAQFMPGTWRDVSSQLGYENITPYMAEPAIYAGAYYMAKMRKVWHSKRPEVDRHSLALACYNAGCGHVIKAQRLCHGKLLYRDVIKCLPDVTGHNSRETITYVSRIWGYWQQMVLGG
jgi:membrane-bound lytic murein transglycosylase F